MTLAVEDQFTVVDELDAVLGGEGFCAGADEVDVRAFVEDEAGGLDGVAEVFDAGYAAGAQGGSVHEEGVELNATLAGEEAAPAGVEGGVVFEDGDGGFYGVGGAAAFFEDGVAGSEGLGDAALVVFGHLRGDGPSAAVDDEGRDSGWGLGGHVQCTGYSGWRRPLEGWRDDFPVRVEQAAISRMISRMISSMISRMISSMISRMISSKGKHK